MRISDWSSDVCSSDLLGKSPAFLNLTCGSGLVGLVGFGLNLFLIPLLVRRHGMDLTQAGLIFALSFSFATALGTTTGGFVADWLGRRDVRWYGWAPALLLCLALRSEEHTSELKSLMRISYAVI